MIATTRSIILGIPIGGMDIPITGISNMQRYLLLLVLLFILSACTTAGKRQVMGEREISPAIVVEEGRKLPDTVLEWGGTIVDSQNLPTTTEIRILAYPLQEDGQPETEKPTTGRFIAIVHGYLETADYRAGRQVTLSGKLRGIRDGKVGEADYRFPVIEADALMLWPLPLGYPDRTGVHFGFGLGSGGWSGGSIGIGFGF